MCWKTISETIRSKRSSGITDEKDASGTFSHAMRSILSAASTPATRCTRFASARVRRPTPQPKSSADFGVMSINSRIRAISASPVAKNASRSSADIRSRRKRSSVRTAKNGSLSPSAFQSSAERSRILGSVAGQAGDLECFKTQIRRLPRFESMPRSQPPTVRFEARIVRFEASVGPSRSTRRSKRSINAYQGLSARCS